MGYSTYFDGQFSVTPPLTPDRIAYMKAFSATRRMMRKTILAADMPDPLRESVGLAIGEQGAYFVGGGGDFGQERDASVIDYNEPPAGQPGLWCNWEPSDDGSAIRWNESEKFYNYVEWIRYIADHFLGPWGHKINGNVRWSGEDRDDIGAIVAKENAISTKGT